MSEELRGPGELCKHGHRVRYLDECRECLEEDGIPSYGPDRLPEEMDTDDGFAAAIQDAEDAIEAQETAQDAEDDLRLLERLEAGVTQAHGVCLARGEDPELLMMLCREAKVEVEGRG